MNATATHITVDPHEPLPVIGYSIVTVRIALWEGDEIVGHADEDYPVRVPAGRSPASMVGISPMCGDSYLGAVLIPFAEFKELTKPVPLGDFHEF